jgi:hypothetical protein
MHVGWPLHKGTIPHSNLQGRKVALPATDVGREASFTHPSGKMATAGTISFSHTLPRKEALAFLETAISLPYTSHGVRSLNPWKPCVKNQKKMDTPLQK